MDTGQAIRYMDVVERIWGPGAYAPYLMLKMFDPQPVVIEPPLGGFIDWGSDASTSVWDHYDSRGET